jgi:hypothetical protein
MRQCVTQQEAAFDGVNERDVFPREDRGELGLIVRDRGTGLRTSSSTHLICRSRCRIEPGAGGAPCTSRHPISSYGTRITDNATRPPPARRLGIVTAGWPDRG